MELVKPSIALPASTTAFTTTRVGGISEGRYRGLNLAQHVDDDKYAVDENRRRLVTVGGLPNSPLWMNQVHGTVIIDANEVNKSDIVSADGAYVCEPSIVLAVLSADCLPIVIWDERGRELAVVHGGWKGLLHGVIGAAVSRFDSSPVRLAAWIGPGISQDAYIVDHSFRQRFVEYDSSLKNSFVADGERWRADLKDIAMYLLKQSGIATVEIYNGCTFNDADRFYSYRRDKTTGRMATLAWLSTGP